LLRRKVQEWVEAQLAAEADRSIVDGSVVTPGLGAQRRRRPRVHRNLPQRNGTFWVGTGQAGRTREGGWMVAVPENALKRAAGEDGRSAPTKQQIFRSALELFALQGYDATSARQLAARVGIEAGSLYNHISSKQDLLFQLIQKATYDLIVRSPGRSTRPARTRWGGSRPGSGRT
jgi:hypothetical protein